MRRAGRASWRLSVGDDHMLSAALWTRDAAGIVVDREADDVPPRLIVPPPASDVLADEDRVAVGRDWLSWWRSLLVQKVDAHRNPPPTGVGEDWQQWVRGGLERRTAAGGPDDDFAALAHAPGLRLACRELFRGASQARTRPRLETTPWEVSERLVDEVAATHGVDPNVLDGTVAVVPTGDGWWRVLCPGLVIASEDAPTDDVLRASLESAIGSD